MITIRRRMDSEPKKPNQGPHYESSKIQLRLIIQGNCPIDSADAGEELFDALELFLKNYDPEAMLGGQVLKTLGTCCRSHRKDKPDVKSP